MKESKLKTEDRLAAMQRVAAGEMQVTLAKELGVTRQYIALLWKRYKKKGLEGILDKSTGVRPLRALTEKEETNLRDLFRSTTQPSVLKLRIATGKKDIWTNSLALQLAKRELDFVPKLSQVRELLEKWDIQFPKIRHTIDPVFSDEFYAYLKTPLAKQIRERELAAAAKWEEEREAKRLERAKETELHLKAASDLRTPPAPGQRTGKHAKGGPRHTKKKRRK